MKGFMNMRNFGSLLFVVCLLLLMAGNSLAQSKQVEASRKLDEFTGYNCEDMMAHLDNYAIALQGEPKLQSYIVSYGSHRHRLIEAQAWAIAARDYLVSSRGIEAKRIVMLYGGNRKDHAMELWLLSNDLYPSTTNMVRPKGMKLKKIRTKYRPCRYGV
jgi:hypothetical protein